MLDYLRSGKTEKAALQECVLNTFDIFTSEEKIFTLWIYQYLRPHIVYGMKFAEQRASNEIYSAIYR